MLPHEVSRDPADIEVFPASILLLIALLYKEATIGP
jgi:hypothetical protein